MEEWEGARISVRLGQDCHLLSLLDNMEACLRQSVVQTEGHKLCPNLLQGINI